MDGPIQYARQIRGAQYNRMVATNRVRAEMLRERFAARRVGIELPTVTLDTRRINNYFIELQRRDAVLRREEAERNRARNAQRAAAQREARRLVTAEVIAVERARIAAQRECYNRDPNLPLMYPTEDGGFIQWGEDKK